MHLPLPARRVLGALLRAVSLFSDALQSGLRIVPGWMKGTDLALGTYGRTRLIARQTEAVEGHRGHSWTVEGRSWTVTRYPFGVGLGTIVAVAIASWSETSCRSCLRPHSAVIDSDAYHNMSQAWKIEGLGDHPQERSHRTVTSESQTSEITLMSKHICNRINQIRNT